MILKIITLCLCFLFLGLDVGASSPEVVCNGLPGCDANTTGETQNNISNNDFFSFLGRLIAESIKYVAVISVLSVMVGGIMYLISGGDDAKVEKAKKMITWSLIGVIVSVSAWSIINVVNSLNIN